MAALGPEQPVRHPLASRRVDQLVASTAVALYAYNVSPTERATRLYHYFRGACADLDELLRLVDLPWWATEMPAPTALAYLEHALERYGDEAARRVLVNFRGIV